MAPYVARGSDRLTLLGAEVDGRRREAISFETTLADLVRTWAPRMR